MKNGTIAVVGGETLLGRELDELLKERRFPAEVQLIGAGEATGILTEVAGEATVLTPLDADRLSEARIVICAGEPASTRRAHGLAGKKAAVIDVTAALEDLPNARLRSPLTDREDFRLEPGVVQVIAHPAAIALALLLSRIHNEFPIRHSVVQVFEPASERGKAGINELQQQVGALLSFRPLEKRIFDTQLAFNMLARYGEEALESLQDIESRINRHLTTLLRGLVPAPSLRLIQAPVFHGHSFSLWIEFATRPTAAALASALASDDIDIRSADVEPPANTGVAGQSGVTAGVIEPDANHPRAMWLWAVADNLRIAADAAVEVAEGVFGGARR